MLWCRDIVTSDTSGLYDYPFNYKVNNANIFSIINDNDIRILAINKPPTRDPEGYC